MGTLYVMAPPQPQKLWTVREFVLNVTTEIPRARYALGQWVSPAAPRPPDTPRRPARSLAEATTQTGPKPIDCLGPFLRWRVAASRSFRPFLAIICPNNEPLPWGRGSAERAQRIWQKRSARPPLDVGNALTRGYWAGNQSSEGVSWVISQVAARQARTSQIL